MVRLYSAFALADVINVPADTNSIQGCIYLACKGDTVLDFCMLPAEIQIGVVRIFVS